MPTKMITMNIIIIIIHIHYFLCLFSLLIDAISWQGSLSPVVGGQRAIGKGRKEGRGREGVKKREEGIERGIERGLEEREREEILIFEMLN